MKKGSSGFFMVAHVLKAQHILAWGIAPCSLNPQPKLPCRGNTNGDHVLPLQGNERETGQNPWATPKDFGEKKPHCPEGTTQGLNLCCPFRAKEDEIPAHGALPHAKFVLYLWHMNHHKIPGRTGDSRQVAKHDRCKLIGVPAALIMRIEDLDIAVFVSSLTEGNPYRPGDREHLVGSGLYCEKVINTKKKLLVPNALADGKWKNNPDIKINMVSYLGLPILLPDGTPFGTICVLDQKENAYSEKYERLLTNFRDIVQFQYAAFAKRSGIPQLAVFFLIEKQWLPGKGS